MKKSIALGLLGLAAAAAPSFGQGYIWLDNYSSGTDPMLAYWPGVPANGVSGALGSGGLSSAWTVGFYWAPGNISIVQAGGWDMPDATLTLATGLGSTAQVAGSAFGWLGYYGSPVPFDSGSTANTTLTLEIVVYPTSAGSYVDAPFRYHSFPFTMPTVASNSPAPVYTGDYMGPFIAFPVSPEPTTVAFAALGGLALWLMRRRKA